MEYNIGDWIRFYSNSLRGGGSTTHIGKISKIDVSKSDNVVTGYHVPGFIVNAHYVIGKITVDEQNKIITEDCL